MIEVKLALLLKVTVLGQVVKPGVYVVQNIATIQGAMGEAGGAVTGAQLSQLKLIRAMHQEMSTPTMDNGVGTQVVNKGSAEEKKPAASRNGAVNKGAD